MSEPKKPFDIAKDGDLPVQHTSRPVIVGRTNMVRDPMTVGEDKKTPTSHKDLKISAPKDIKPEEPSSQTPAPETKEALPDSKSTIDDSIVDTKVPPPPNLNVDSPVEKLVKEKTYFLRIGHRAGKDKVKFVISIIFVVVVLALAAYVIIL